MSNKLGAFIRERRGELSLREFARMCDLSHTHLDSIEKGLDPRTGKPVSITTETLHKLAEGMRVSVNYLLNLQLGHDKEPELDINTLEYALYGEARELDSDEKKQLLELARLMRKKRQENKDR